MMASPAASPGDGARPTVQDPWDWTVEDVVTALTSSEGLLRQINPHYSSDSTRLVNFIRDQKIWGSVLLRRVDDGFLEQKMGLAAVGDRVAVLDTVAELQDQSPKFSNYQMKQASRTVPSSYGPSSNFGDSRSAYQQQINHFGHPMMPPLRRYLAEPLRSSDTPAIQVSERIPFFGDSANANSATEMWRRPSSIENIGYARSINDFPQPEQLEADPENPKFDRELTSIDNIKTPQRADHQDQEQMLSERSHRTLLLGDEADSNPRPGEKYIVDDTGRKRRKLDLYMQSESTKDLRTNIHAPEEITLAPTSRDMNLQIETMESPVNGNDLQSAGESCSIVQNKDANLQTNNTNPPLNELPSFTSLETATQSVSDYGNAGSSSIENDSIDVMSRLAANLLKPGEMEIDAQGRKRMRPILVTRLEEEEQQQLDKSTIPIMSSEDGREDMSVVDSGLEIRPTDSVMVDSKLKSGRRQSSNTYLGLNALPVDKIFYGDTAMDQLVNHDEQQGTIISLEGKGIEKGNDSWFLFSNHAFGRGTQIYVNNRLKFYLSRPEPMVLNRRSETSYGIIPYPARVVQTVKRHQQLSLTLVTETGSGLITKRVDRSVWLKESNQDRNKSQVSSDSYAGTDTFGGSGNHSLLAHLGENEIHDWDFLEKWRYRANDDDILPLYGDSGSDGELDLETWQEMEREEAKKGRKLERPLGQSKNKHLSDSDVSDAIERAVNSIVAEWEAKKLPLLDRKAWRLWIKSRRDRSKRSEIGLSAGKIVYLEHRLSGLKHEILLERWSKVERVTKQCQSLHRTVFYREFEKWKIGILELKSPPAKPIQLEKPLVVKQPQSMPESLGEDEEDIETDHSGFESSDDDLDGFIVDEDLEITDEQHIRDSIYGSPDPVERVPMLSQDVKPLAVNEKIHDYQNFNTPPRKDKELQNSSSTVNTPTSELLPSDVLTEQSRCHDLLCDNGNLPSPSPILLGVAPAQSRPHQDLITPSSVNELITPHDYIDLTQASDSPKPSSPQVKEEQYRICTPPLDDRNPFHRARRAPTVFKAPPTPSKIINMESDDSLIVDDSALTDESSPSPEKKNLPSSPIKKLLPDLEDTAGIASLDCALLVERKDRKRLLTWIIAHTPVASRKQTLLATSNRSSVDIQWDIWSALRAIKGHAKKVRRYDASSESFMQIAAWYVSWHMCRVYLEKNGFPERHVKETIESEAGFEEFYNFLVERLDTIELNTEKQNEERRKTEAKRKFLPPENAKSKLSSHKRQKYLDDEPNVSNQTAHKKRKHPPPESQTALQMRNNAQQRAQERLRRQAQLQNQLSKMGASAEDPAAMIVNGKAGDETIIVNNQTGSRIQPHQLEGIQFMWGEIVTDGEEQGCLLAHSMGLGKTMQVITLLVTIAEASQHSNPVVSDQIPQNLRITRAVILCPPSLVDNWYDELLMWMPGTGSTILGEPHKISAAINLQERLNEIQKWADNGGVLLVGYNMFKDLVHNKPKGKADNKKQSLTDEEHEKVRSNLLELASIIVADEAHTIKTRTSDISKAVQGFASKRRIALTGSPLANNLMEYYTIIDWIAPGYLGSRAEFSYKYVEPIGDGLFADASQYQKRKGLKMLQVLKADLAPKVHRADVSILKGRLKGKTEFVLRVPLTKLQYDSYKLYVEYMLAAIKSKEPGSARLWAWLAILRLLCNHPLCFKNKLMEEPKTKKPKKKAIKQQQKPKEAESQTEIAIALQEDIDDILDDSVENVGLPKEMINEQLARFAQETIPIESVNLAHKMQLLLQIVQLSATAGDKVLVFSHSLDTLDFIGRLLQKNKYAYERLDGATKMSSRQQLTKDFNQNESNGPNICLISTKAGGQGLNLFGANRVVIMDDTFNPMYEEQAIGRAYRIGQQKHVYVYRLTVGGSFEQALQDQSLFKLQLANRVVDKKNPMRHALKGAREYLFEPKIVDQKDLQEFVGKDPKVLDNILSSQDDAPIICSIDLSETFQQEVDEPLTAEEQREAEQMVNDEKLRRTDPAAYEKVRLQRQAEQAKEQAQSLGLRTEMHPNYPTLTAHAADTRISQVRSPYSSNIYGSRPPLAAVVKDDIQDRKRLLTRGPLSNTLGPPASSAMTNSEWQQLQQQQAGATGSASVSSFDGKPTIQIESDRRALSPPLNGNDLPSIGSIERTGTTNVAHNGLQTFSNRPGHIETSVLMPKDADVLASPNPSRAISSLSDNDIIMHDSAIMDSNMDPVHGPNIQVRQRSLSGSPENAVSPKRPLRYEHSPKLPNGRPQIPSVGDKPQANKFSRLDSPFGETVAVSAKESSDLVNPDLPEVTIKIRDDLRSSLVPHIAKLIHKEVKNGKLTSTNELDVTGIAKVLGDSMERHAYKNAGNQKDYSAAIKDTLSNFSHKSNPLSALVRQAQRKLNSKSSRSRGTTQSRQLSGTPKTPRQSETRVMESIEADHSETLAADAAGESVGVSVPSPLSKPPDLSLFQSLQQMMHSEANRKTG